MHKRHVSHVMKSEWKKSMKTPVQLVMMLLVPLLSVLFLAWAMSYVRGFTTNYQATVLFEKKRKEKDHDQKYYKRRY